MSLVIRHKENRKEYWGLQANVSSLTYGTDGSLTLAMAAGKAWTVTGAAAWVAPSGNPGSGFAFTTGAAVSGNNNGGDITYTLGAGVGTGRNGRVVINSTQVSTGTSNNNGVLTINATWSPAGGSANSMQAISAILTTTAGTGITGPSIAAIEMQHLYTGSTACTQLLYGSESTFDQQGSGALTGVTGFQGNVRGTTGTGPITTATGIDVTAGLFQGNVATLRGFQVGTGDQTGAGVITAVIGYSSTLLYGMGSGTYVTGGLSVYGAQISIPSQGGNTAGTDTNIGLRVTGLLTGAGLGQPGGAGGAVKNYGILADVPAGLPNGGTVDNYGLFLQGNGAATATTNFALYSTSTAPSILTGQLTIGSNVAPGTAVLVNVAGSPTATTGAMNIIRLHGTITSSNGQNNSELQVQVTTSAAATGTMYGVSVIAPSLGAAVTTVHGGIIANQGSASSTNAVGWNVAAQSGSTNNINLMLGTTLPAGTWNIYSDSASNNSLLGSLVVGSNTAPAASTFQVASGFSTILGGKITTYNGVGTAGWGVPAVEAAAGLTAQTGAAASVATFTVGAGDAEFYVSANVNVTTSTTHNFTVTVTYTDETNVVRTETLSFSQLNATLLSAITNVTGAGPYSGLIQHIRAKAGTTITIATTGTFTTVTYNVRGAIVQIA